SGSSCSPQFPSSPNSGQEPAAIPRNVRSEPRKQREGTTMTSNLDGERADILAGLASGRHFLRFAARDLTDEQARQRTTVSELSLGGLIKHVAGVEQGWATFTVEGPSALGNFDDMSDADMARWADQFKLLPDETLAGVLAD